MFGLDVQPVTSTVHRAIKWVHWRTGDLMSLLN
jgi:hypothetical protein